MNNKLMFSKNSDEWSTPQDYFNGLNEIYHFDLDPCCTHENKKCPRYFTAEVDGLAQSWQGHKVFVNPPYSKIGAWVKKCSDERIGANIIALLIPARTDTRYFHEYIYKMPGVTIDFIKGRLKFGGNKNAAPFPSMLVIFKA